MSTRFYALARRCKFPGFSFKIDNENGLHFLRVVCMGGQDNRTGEAAPWEGRKWRLSPHMTDGEVVQTAFMATMAAIGDVVCVNCGAPFLPCTPETCPE